MIEKFTEEELKQIILELKDYKHDIGQRRKGFVLSEEARNVLGGRPYITTDIRKSILTIADILTNNYERVPTNNKNTVGYRDIGRKDIPEDKEKEIRYREIIKGILSVMKPDYGVKGFDSIDS